MRELSSGAGGTWDALDLEVLAFRAGFDGRSPLDDLVRQGAQRMLHAALESEVQSFLERHARKVDGEAGGWWCGTDRCRRGTS